MSPVAWYSRLQLMDDGARKTNSAICSVQYNVGITSSYQQSGLTQNLLRSIVLYPIGLACVTECQAKEGRYNFGIVAGAWHPATAIVLEI